MRVIIGEDFNNKTIKDWLYGNNVSRALITRLKKIEYGISVNGEHATVRRVLNIGDELSLAIDDRIADQNSLLIPSEMPLDIIFEDDDMVAVNKPAGIPTHPSHGHFTDTLANGLAYYYKSRGTPFVFRAVNRLDRDTSGVVLIAKNQYAASELTALMQSGKIHKTYIAVLNGIPEPKAGLITSPIRRRAGTIILREVFEPEESMNVISGVKDAMTSYETLAENGAASIVRAEPLTGRTHQLRVHFAHIGTPIVGDRLYGSAESSPTELDTEIGRHALHAAMLIVERETGILRLSAKLPSDLQILCNKVKGAEFLL